MRNAWVAALALGLAAATAAGAGLGVGDKAPLPQAKEVIGLPSYAPKDLEGKVVFLEIFRTW